jgi:hypothetical protein
MSIEIPAFVPRGAVAGSLCAALLLAGGPAAAAVLRVPSSAYPTVQSALTAAAVLPGTHEVKLRAGTFHERVTVPAGCCAGQVRVSGGWDASFTSVAVDFRLTRLEGGGGGRVVSIPDLDSGLLIVENLTIQGGRLPARAPDVAFGAGAAAFVNSSGRLAWRGVRFRANTIVGDRPDPAEAQGAGALVLLEDAGRLLVEGCLFDKNAIFETGGARLAAQGAGLNLQVFGGDATVRGTTFRHNAASGSVFGRGGGLDALVEDVGGVGLTLEDSEFDGNRVESAASGSRVGSGAVLWTAGSGGEGPTLVARRNRFLDNLGGRTQAHVVAARGARVDLSDSLVARGDRGGLHVFADDSTAHVTNLTVADQAGTGIETAQAGTGALSIFNTIAFGNAGGDLAVTGGAAPDLGSNLIGIDPLFGGPPFGEYCLSSGTPALNAGDDAPPGGLGPRELYGRPRVWLGRVDIGACEGQREIVL